MGEFKIPVSRFFWLVITLAFWVKAFISIDPDFGWRLTTGYQILDFGVPKTDVYSYTMPSFPWVNHAWLNDVVFTTVYSGFGYLGLSLLFSVLTVLSIYISVRPIGSYAYSIFKNNKFFSRNIKNALMPMLILTCASLLRFSGIRAQTWTWFFLAILINLLFNTKLWSSLKKSVPVIFLVWANLHGGFVAGLGLLGVHIITQAVRRGHGLVNNLAILVFSFFATLINPYGINIYREVWSSVADTSLGNRVMEWNPFFESFSLSAMFLVVISTVLVFRYRSRLGISVLVMFFIFLYQAITTVRQVPLFSLFVLPVVVSGILVFLYEIRSNKIAVERFKTLNSHFLKFAVIVFVIELFVSYKASYILSEDNFYPLKAVNFLKNQTSVNQIFSDYGWGGYLIWRLSEKKVFIDGRMPSWRRQEAPLNESTDAMREYVGIIEGEEGYYEVFDKYSIDTVLLPKPKLKGPLELLESKYYDQLDPLYRLLGKKHLKFNFLEKIKSDGWKLIYSDDIAVIYKK